MNKDKVNEDASGDTSDSGFLSRWSRRKAQVRQGQEPEGHRSVTEGPSTRVAAGIGPAATTATRATPASAAPGTASTASRAADAPAAPAHAIKPESGAASDVGVTTPGQEAPPAPTLQDVEQLDATSDYRAFVARDVDPQVRNAAFKKLFHSDPHFNVMDGLDVYIDDYNTPQPLSLAVMKTLVQARALGLIDDELKDQELPSPDPTLGQSAPVAVESQSGAPQDAQAGHPGGATGAGQDSPEPLQVAVQVRAQEQEQAQAQAARSAEVVHVLHLEPLNEASPATSPTADPGKVVPFPRRPGSADPA